MQLGYKYKNFTSNVTISSLTETATVCEVPPPELSYAVATTSKLPDLEYV